MGYSAQNRANLFTLKNSMNSFFRKFFSGFTKPWISLSWKQNIIRLLIHWDYMYFGIQLDFQIFESVNKMNFQSFYACLYTSSKPRKKSCSWVRKLLHEWLKIMVLKYLSKLSLQLSSVENKHIHDYYITLTFFSRRGQSSLPSPNKLTFSKSIRHNLITET